MNARVLLLFQALLVAVDLSVQSCGPSASPSPAPRTFGLAPIAAHLQFSQVGNTPATGQSGAAYVAIQPTGPSATPANIVAGNGTNTGVARWTYYLLDVPVGSALTSSSLVPAQDGSLSTFTIPETPVIEGTYRVGLTVFDNRGNQASDVRDVVVPTYAKGLLIPSYLSDNGTHNYPIPAVGGQPQTRGWMPDLQKWALAIDTLSAGLQGNTSNPTGLPLFSPVSTTELINANGDNLNGGGHYFGCNRGGTHCENTHGVGFWVTDVGHLCTGVRFWWQGDPVWEPHTTVRCRLWDFRSPGTSVATGTLAVDAAHEYACTFGTPYTLVAGRPYAVSIVDIGPCTGGSGGGMGLCVLGATQFNSTGVDQSCGNMYANNAPVWGSPWLEFADVATGVTGEHYFWAGLESSGVGDFFPQGTDQACSPQEPIVQ